MGVSLTPILKKREVTFTELQGKVLAVDGFNILYQFLTTIRARDGTPLTDSHGNVTSHLIGLFSRTTNLMSKGMKLIFVFDGEAPELKKKERERRASLKDDAQVKFDAAQAAEDVDTMRKYASRTTRLTPEMLTEAKKLLTGLGIPIIQAPSEGEAQAAHMVQKGDAYAVISQDADAFLFGAPRVIRNLGISGKRKKGMAYEPILPEMVNLKETLDELEINQDQLIALAVLTGTDFAIGGVKGLGPKKGLKLVKEHSLEEIPVLAKWDEHQDVEWQDVLDVFHKMPVLDDYEIKWSKPDIDAVKKLLVDQHDFNPERVESSLEKLDDGGQTGLGQYF
jgi:flap endonuclease-1